MSTTTSTTLLAQRKLSASTSVEKATRPTMDRVDRASFSSTKESHTDSIAQSFTDSKTSSYLRHEYLQSQDEEVIDDSASSSSGVRTPQENGMMKMMNGGGMITRESRLLGFVCPCEGFRGWKGIPVKGRLASRSSSDLRGLGMGAGAGTWMWENDVEDVKMGGTEVVKLMKGSYSVGQSPLERLPVELLGKFFP
jgi:hypothetical protein